MKAMRALSLVLLAGVTTSLTVSTAFAAKARKACFRTPGGYVVCQQGNQACSTSPQGKTVCVTHGSNPPPPTPSCTTLPDGTRICVSGR